MRTGETNMKKIGMTLCLCAVIVSASCHGGGVDLSSLVDQIDGATAPVLEPLSITSSDSGSIALAAPTFSEEGSPAPEVRAYIGINGAVHCAGPVVTGSIQGPVCLYGEGCRFSGLEAGTVYRVIVTARNLAGTSVREIIQSTAAIAPVLSALTVSGTEESSITLERPCFATAGNPVPEVLAYIGFDGVMFASGSLVKNRLRGPVDVSTGGCLFDGLAPATYRVIVVAENSAGYSVAQVVQATGGVAPVLSNLVIAAAGESSIELARPALEVAGSPQPAVEAYIGYAGTITVSGTDVCNSTGGPLDVSRGGCLFGGLEAGADYEIVVVARNSVGYSVKSIAQATASTAPVLNDLVIEAVDASSVTLARPTFAVAGNPLPAVSAYIGPEENMVMTDGSVSGFSQGPVDVSLGGCRFEGLAAGVSHRVVVVARNAAGYSAREIAYAIPAVNLYFSEYIEGSSNNKALEIFNAGACAVPMAGHVAVTMFANGGVTPYTTCQCAGVIGPGEVYVIANPRAGASVTEKADVLHDVCGFNGNDALVLYYDGVPVDAIGQAGFNPGTEWLDGGLSTMNRTLRRKPWVARGDADPWNAFVLSGEWDGYPCDAFDDLGAYAR
jgi:hypothetical protein